ncbi:MAG TPA: hypothetical protein PK006_10760 [Saprospiraceae bacterium]|nr:hypothetical protein [Saprospiraceae bacterium]
MKKVFILALIIFYFCSTGEAENYYAAVNGSSTASGSIAFPWDIKTAFTARNIIRAGDTLWLRGGRYFGSDLVQDVAAFRCELEGSKLKPIVVISYPGEIAILDGGNRTHPVPPDPNLDSYTLGILGSYVHFVSIEIINSNPHARSDSLARFKWRVRAVLTTAVKGFKLINSIIHDTGNGIESFVSCEECEYYGNIIFNNGWSHLGVRGHGEGIYSQNRYGWKLISENIIFNQFDNGLILYGSRDAFVDSFKLEGNVVFQNGIINDNPNGWGFLLGKNGGGTRANYFEIRDNFFYNRFDYLRSNNLDLGYQSGMNQLILENNYSVGRNPVKYNIPIDNLTANGNTFVGELQNVALEQMNNGQNTIHSLQNLPNVNQVFLRPNFYESGRAHIIVYNWEDKDEIDILLDHLGLSEGDEFEIMDVQNIFGPSVRIESYKPGNKINLPLKLTSVTQVIGDAVPRKALHTESLFNVFLVRKTKQAVSNKIDQTKFGQLAEVFWNDETMTVQFKTSGVYKLEVFNAEGKQLFVQDCIGDSLQFNLPRNQIYFLILNDGKQVQRIKAGL